MRPDLCKLMVRSDVITFAALINLKDVSLVDKHDQKNFTPNYQVFYNQCVLIAGVEEGGQTNMLVLQCSFLIGKVDHKNISNVGNCFRMRLGKRPKISSIVVKSYISIN